MFGCKTDVASSLHTPEGIWCRFHVCCLPGSWGYPISHSNTGNRISWKTDFCGFLPCSMPEPVTWMRLLVALSFLFNNYFIYRLQKPIFFPRCSLLIRFPLHHWSPIVLGGWAIQETRSLDYTAIPAGIQSRCIPSPHSSALQRSSSQHHFQSGGTGWTAMWSPFLLTFHLLHLRREREIPSARSYYSAKPI